MRDGEAGSLPVRLQIVEIDAIHTRSRRSIVQPLRELLDAGTWPLDLKLDFTARKISDQAREAKAIGPLARGVAKTDTLDAASNHSAAAHSIRHSPQLARR